MELIGTLKDIHNVDHEKVDVATFPLDWDLLPMASLFTFKNGLNKGKEYFGKGTPIVNYMDIFQNSGLNHNQIRGEVLVTKDEIKNYQVLQGDVFFTRTSETVDEIGVSSVMLDNIPNTVFSGFILRARPKNNLLDLIFKKYCFKSEFVRRQIVSSSSYTTRALTNGRLLSQILIPVPQSKVEQRLIATALSDTDALISSLDKLIAKKKAIKQGTMQQLLTGKKRLPGFNGEWEVKKLGKLAFIQRGASPRPIDSPHWFNDLSKVGWVRISDVTKSIKYLKVTTQKLSDAGVKNSRFVPKGNLIMSICATVGRPILTEIDVCIHDGFVVFNDPSIEKDYLYHVLTFIEKDWSKNGQTGSQMNLNTTIINTTEVTFPQDPLEQRGIAEVLTDMDFEIESCSSKRDKYKSIKQGMMQELLTGKTRLI